MRELSAGDDAVLLDYPGAAHEARRAAHRLQAAMARGALTATDVVLSAESVLVSAEPGTGVDRLAVQRVIRSTPPSSDRASSDGESGETVIPVVYDGADLHDVAGLSGVDVETLVRAHTSIRWRVQFMGFAPGFGYLVPDDGSDPADVALFTDLSRRDESRPAVPSGTVAVAAGYSAVYPRISPGGWQLIGRTETTMWDVDADPPATLHPGRAVRFSCQD